MGEKIDNGTSPKIPLYLVLASDHLTPATSKTLAITISKNGAAFGNPSAGATNATEVASGWYYYTPSATDTGTNGPLLVLGIAASCDNATRDYTVVAAGSTSPTAAQIAFAVCDEVNTGATHNVNNSVGKQIRSSSVNTGVIYTATAPSQAGMTSTQIKLDAGASAVDNVYQWDVISINSGTNAGDSSIITAYNGTTKVATVNNAWALQPDATSVFAITPTAQVQVVSYISGQAPLQPTVDLRKLDVSTGGEAGLDWANIGSPTTTVGLTGTTINVAIKKNTALANFLFYMALASDNKSPATGLTITSTRSLDGAAFASTANSATAVSGGWYKIDLAAADVNANTVALEFAGAAANTTRFTFATQP